MISRKTANLLGQNYMDSFSGERVYRSDLYDFLFDHDFSAWFCNAAKRLTLPRSVSVHTQLSRRWRARVAERMLRKISGARSAAGRTVDQVSGASEGAGCEAKWAVTARQRKSNMDRPC
jgi:hypothetical protein